MGERTHSVETVRDGDVEIVTCIDGEGPSLVVLPSYGRDGLGDFDALTALTVAAGWRVLRPQPRGVAGSRGPMRNVDLIALAKDVALVILRHADGPAVVLGHGFGNFIGRVLATEHGELVRGLILAAASASKVAPDINETPFIAGDPERSANDRLAALKAAFFAPGHDPRPWLGGWYPETLKMQRQAVQATDVAQYWPAGAAPVLELNAEHDPFKPRALWGELRDQMGERVTTILIRDAAHALFPEQPEQVAAAVTTWVDRLP